MLAGIAGIILRRRERRKIIGYSRNCGESYQNETEQNNHAAIHKGYSLCQ